MDQKNFQIVLLPQGKFQDFLLANTGEKLKILSTLFDVSLYAKLSKKFSDDSKAIIARKEDLKNNKIGVLLTKEFNSSEELETSLAHEKYQTKSLSVNAINLKKGFEKVRDLKQEFERLVAEEETLSALLDNKDEFDQLREYIDKLKNAEKLQPLHTSLKDKKNKHTNAANQLNLSKDELEKTENRLASYNNDMSSIEEKKENFNLKREKLNDLKDFRVRFKSSKKDQEELNLHDNDIKELNKYIEKKELDHQLKGVLANEELQQNFKEIKDEVARLETLTAKLEKRLDTANMAYEKAEQDLSEMQAIHLSRKLIEGKPCPVCGSHNHPNPAKGLAESKGLNDAFESAKEERDTITVDHSNAKNSLANKKFQLGVLNKTLSDKETPLLSSKEIKVQISALGYEENEEYEQH